MNIVSCLFFICFSDDDLASKVCLNVFKGKILWWSDNSNYQQTVWSVCGASLRSRCQWMCRHKPGKIFKMELMELVPSPRKVLPHPPGQAPSAHTDPSCGCPCFFRPGWWCWQCPCHSYGGTEAPSYLYVWQGAPWTCRSLPRGMWTLHCQGSTLLLNVVILLIVSTNKNYQHLWASCRIWGSPRPLCHIPCLGWHWSKLTWGLINTSWKMSFDYFKCILENTKNIEKQTQIMKV